MRVKKKIPVEYEECKGTDEKRRLFRPSFLIVIAIKRFYQG